MAVLSDTTALILAGGLGSRLRSIVAHRQKVVAAVNGRMFVEYVLEQIVAAGLKSAILCVGYQAAQVRAALGDHFGPLRLSYSEDTQPLGTAGALRLAVAQPISDPVLVFNGDSFCQTNLDTLWQAHQQTAANATLTLAHQANTADYGRVEFEGNGQITHFHEKQSGAGPGWVNAGIYVIRADWLRAIPAGRNLSLERDVFPGWIGRGLYGFVSNGQLLDIGTPERYEIANDFFTAREARHV